MYIDIGIAVVVALFALFGLLSGFWGQILRLAALVSLFFLAPPVARAIQGPVADVLGTDTSPQMVWGTSLIVAAVLLYIGMSLVIAIILHSAKAYKDMSGASRVAGFFLGLLKGAVATYLLACGFAMVGQAGHLSGAVEQQSAESHVVTLVAKYNLVEKMGYSLEEIVAEFTHPQVEGSGQQAVPPQQPQVPTTMQPPAQPSTMQLPAQPPSLQPPVQPTAVPSAPVQPTLQPPVQPTTVQPQVPGSVPKDPPPGVQ
ncbi:MAG: CvpA family protein [Bradymonadales bacterium]|nr:CvpA family protein [Bradymonadales bacterium]